MPDTDKAESKPQTSEDPQTDEEHPLEAARREGLRAAPLSQTRQLDTTEGGVTDLHRVSPVFEEARQHAIRAGAAAADEEYLPLNVVFPDDKDEAERARRHVKAAAAELPDEEEDDARPVSLGQGGDYNRDMVEKDAAARAGQETEATGTNPLSGENAKDEDKDGASKPSASGSAKAPAKPARATSTTSKTASK